MQTGSRWVLPRVSKAATGRSVWSGGGCTRGKSRTLSSGHLMVRINESLSIVLAVDKKGEGGSRQRV